MAKQEAKKSSSKKEKGIKKQKNSFISKEDSPKKEEVCEVFDVKKNGKEETIKSCGIEEEKSPSQEQIKGEKKIFLKIMLVMGGLVLFFLSFYLVTYFQNNFEVNGVKFNVDKTDMQGQTIYKTFITGTSYNGVFIPGGTIGKKTNFNFYLRGDPRKTENIPFNGSIVLTKTMVLNQKENFACNGGYIGIANLLNLYNAISVKVISDENVSCDNQGQYVYINIQNANETSIEQFGPTCYNINVKNCEILPVTEKMMIETLSYIDKKIKG